MGEGRVGVDKIDWFPLPSIPSHGGEGKLLGKLFYDHRDYS
jgi:hypothetical protein